MIGLPIKWIMKRVFYQTSLYYIPLCCRELEKKRIIQCVVVMLVLFFVELCSLRKDDDNLFSV